MGVLKLDYAFLPDPNPIRASAKGANPNAVDLLVIISNPHTVPVTLARITIRIPVGEPDSASLSALPDLPAPRFDETQPWGITSKGSIVTVLPTGSGQVGVGAILFTLPGIQVNQTPSAGVPLTITEYYPDGNDVADSTTYSLVKQPSDFPVTNFYADPDTLDDLELPLTLYWECSDQGKSYAYNLRSDDSIGWVAGDCLGAGNCLDWADGAPGTGGVAVPPVTPAPGTTTITFYLDVISTAGGRSIYQTLSTIVQVRVATIDPHYGLSSYFSGRLVVINWLAYNAAKCAIELADGTVLIDNAPADTYRQGYTLFLPGEPRSYPLVLAAYPPSGNPVRKALYPEVTVTASITNLPLPGNPVNLAVAPDNSVVVISGYDANLNASVTVVDLATNEIKATIPVSINAGALAVTPDSKRALVTAWDDPHYQIVEIDLDGLCVSGTVPLPVGVGRIAITPDGKLVLLGIRGPGMMVLDGDTLAVRTTIQMPVYSLGIAVTPDGSLAFTPCNTVVTVVDLASLTVKTSIPVASNAGYVAITPDGRFAVVVHDAPGGVTVIDIPRLEALAWIPMPSSMQTVAVTADSRLALVGHDVDSGTGQVFAVDLAAIRTLNRPATLSAGAGSIPMGAMPFVAIPPNGKRLLTIASGSLTLI